MASSSELKQQFEAELGKEAWNEGWEAMLRFSPEAFKTSLELHAVPKRKQHLSRKIQALLALSVDASATHLYVPGIQEKVKAALRAGASVAEITEVIECTSTLGVHACNIGVPLLVEVMREEGVYDIHPAAGQMDEKKEKLKEEFTRNRGYWHTFWEDFLKLDPEFFEAYMNFSSVPWVKDVNGDGKGGGVLEPKVKELIYCAFDVAATHLYQPGLKLHMRNALRYGASPEEIMEVLEIATALSLHTEETAFPILAQCVDDNAGKQ
ncbi:hypothetical protein NA57DRAFT_62873 [Rhizodiscina lignyota]|uniref:Carboxymuconolactone decarboxylase-like domain-containing protein n=1 Tax=Rhizodiscina lignyota TaxID=1504668 RepID=A0A9P4IRV5_9PEZI|nr:hypothetical protein NA57DRAFT_62873 [Rhizodiscina lignyota]